MPIGPSSGLSRPGLANGLANNKGPTVRCFLATMMVIALAGGCLSVFPVAGRARLLSTDRTKPVGMGLRGESATHSPIVLGGLEQVGRLEQERSGPRQIADANHWRRTHRGWEDTRRWVWPSSQRVAPAARIHPALVAGLQLLLGLAALVGFSHFS